MQSIKWTSLTLIFILATTVGNKIAQKYKKRVKELQELKIILNIIETKIKFTQQPLAEIFKEIAQDEKGNLKKSENIKEKSNKEKIQQNKEKNTNIKKIFKEVSENIQEQSIEEGWRQAIEKNREKLNLTEEDIGIIERIGKNLGKTDVEGQIKEIEVTKQFIEGQIEKAEEDRKKNEKMYKTLGVVTGMGIVIILI